MAKPIFTSLGRPWTPSESLAFRLVSVIRLTGALHSLVIADCDEVYNYWEPLHLVTHGSAFQTWEYSPEFAIRSWAYILLHSPPVLLTKLVTNDKRAAFFALRVVLGLISTLIECRLYGVIVEHINPRIGRYFLALTMFSAGMWNASTAFLPSSFSLHFTNLAYTYAMIPASSTNSNRILKATLCFATSAIVGWPFAVLLALPFVAEELLYGSSESASSVVQRFMALLRAGLIAMTLLAPLSLIDSYLYGRWVFVPLNIVRYNVFSDSATLYGTESSLFYLLNGFLNFNIGMLLALSVLPVVALSWMFDYKRLGGLPKIGQASGLRLIIFRLAPFYLWFTILTLQPHKEERFLFPAYGLLCFNAATCIYLIRGLAERLLQKHVAKVNAAIASNISIAIMVVFFLLSISRITALHQYYKAPELLLKGLQQAELPRLAMHYNRSNSDVLEQLSFLDDRASLDLVAKTISEGGQHISLDPLRPLGLTLCYGSEWYRFPSRYLVPDVLDVALVQSAFNGSLPKPFTLLSTQNSLQPSSHLVALTRSFQPFNDRNRDDDNQYVDRSDCAYLIESREAHSTHEDSWDLVECLPFLDNANSNQLTRMLYFPSLTWQSGNSFQGLCLVRAKSISKEVQ